MAKKRLSDVSKWDEDWYLALPPKMKCVWDLLEITCEGTGFRKIGFEKLSRDIGEKITREDFEKHFGDRIYWIDSETVWVFSAIAVQFKELSAKNKAHVNIAKLVVKELAGHSLSERAQKTFVKIENLLRESPDPHPTVTRESAECHPTLIENRIQNIENRKQEEGAGETYTAPSDVVLAAEHYALQFQKTQKTASPPFLREAEYLLLRKLLQTPRMNLERLKRLITTYLTMDSEWFDKKGRDLQTLDKNLALVFTKTFPAKSTSHLRAEPESRDDVRAMIEHAFPGEERTA